MNPKTTPRNTDSNEQTYELVNEMDKWTKQYNRVAEYASNMETRLADIGYTHDLTMWANIGLGITTIVEVFGVYATILWAIGYCQNKNYY